MTTTLSEPTVPADGAAAPPPPPGPTRTPAPTQDRPIAVSMRLAAACAFPVLGTAIMAGGVFTGASARVHAGVAGVLGIALAVVAQRVRRPLVSNLLVVAGILAIGLLLVVPTGIGNVADVRGLVSDASASRDVLRPPVPFTAGWHAILGWLMALVGFVAAWVAIALRLPALSLLVPLPVAALAGISVPGDSQEASGVAVLLLFAVGLGLLASSQTLGEGEERPPLGYEVRKALKSLPLLAGITVGLVLIAQADFLFPDPFVDPTQEPQRPKTTPLAQVEDRVLFRVESAVSGPWRIGSLDVYDGETWRLPPFAQNQLEGVPRSGIVDEELRDRQGLKATFTIAGLGGAVLPTVPNTVGIVAEGPELAYDARNANIRLEQGQVEPGLRYTVTAAALPSVDDLRRVDEPVPEAVEAFADMPADPPPGVAALIARAPTTSRWDRFDFLRSFVLDNVVAAGAGVPAPVTPARVDDMIVGSKEASPFEIVAAQAMLARWIGVPARIGYGFDGGEVVEGAREVRPRNGAAFVEVYFPGYKWLPVIGTPRKAKATVGGDPSQQQSDPSIQPSDDVKVQLYLPVVDPAESVFFEQVRLLILLLAAAVAVAAVAYALWPVARKLRRRARRRAAALAEGPHARVALAYAEWRDWATDFGYEGSETPLAFLDRVVPDDEHTELAWLVSRTLWGDLRDDVDDDMATVAEELSRTLRRRLAAAQPWTVRAVAAVSRLSLRRPYAPALLADRRDRALAPV